MILYTLMQLQNASTVEELHHLLESEEYDFRYNLGVAEQVHKVCIEERDAICTHMAKHFAIYHVKGELDQILCGLSETLGIRSDPIMRCLLVPSWSQFTLLREAIVENRKKL